MAESLNFGGATRQMAIDPLSPGGNISFSVDSDNVQMAGGVVLNINGTKLRDIYRSEKSVTQLMNKVVLNVLGGVRYDQDVENINAEYLHVQVHCHTDERFLEVLADCESGNMASRLVEEFLQIGLNIKNLRVVIENMYEVKVKKARIRR